MGVLRMPGLFAANDAEVSGVTSVCSGNFRAREFSVLVVGS